MSSLRPDGRTALYDAVMAGLDRLDEGSRSRKVLIVMSDGGDNASRATLDQVLDRARQSDATIYTIGLFDPGDPDANPGVLKSLAQMTGGERYLPRSAGPLLLACQRIARDIRSGYTIAFEPSKRDGKYHRIRVEVDRADGRRLAVRTRPGYIAPDGGETMKTAILLRLARADAAGRRPGTRHLVRRRAPRGAFRRGDAGAGSSRPSAGIGSGDDRRSPAPGSSGSWVARLDAPSVQLSATVLEGSDDATLARGAGHIEDTAFPGQPGNIGIAGHRDTTFRAVRNLRSAIHSN